MDTINLPGSPKQDQDVTIDRMKLINSAENALCKLLVSDTFWQVSEPVRGMYYEGRCKGSLPTPCWQCRVLSGGTLMLSYVGCSLASMSKCSRSQQMNKLTIAYKLSWLAIDNPWNTLGHYGKLCPFCLKHWSHKRQSCCHKTCEEIRAVIRKWSTVKPILVANLNDAVSIVKSWFMDIITAIC